MLRVDRRGPRSVRYHQVNLAAMTDTSRDEFAVATKQTLARRVAWKCSFPGCSQSTVGPDSGDTAKAVTTGVAAHIHAAAPGGPRHRPDMTREQRRHISNGIWMCRVHAHIIDADCTEYSADTLRKWKAAAETRAAQRLVHPISDFPDDSTLIQLGPENIFHASWKAISGRKWSFVLIRPELGTIHKLREYITCFDSIPECDSYLVVESQGDARRVDRISLYASQAGQQTVDVVVRRRPSPTDPNSLGADMKLGDDGDLLPNHEMIRGVEVAIQDLMLTMSVRYGGLPWARDAGSFVSEYFAKYSNDLEMLARLIKMELIRTSFIPISSGRACEPSRPQLHFVKRVDSVVVHTNELSRGRLLPVSIGIEWGNHDYWSGDLYISIS